MAKHEYKIVESFKNGSFAKCYALMKKDNNCVDGWKTECKGSKEFCEEALKKRLDRIKQGLEPTYYEQKRKEYKEKMLENPDEYTDELPF